MQRAGSSSRLLAAPRHDGVRAPRTGAQPPARRWQRTRRCRAARSDLAAEDDAAARAGRTSAILLDASPRSRTRASPARGGSGPRRLERRELIPQLLPLLAIGPIAPRPSTRSRRRCSGDPLPIDTPDEQVRAVDAEPLLHAAARETDGSDAGRDCPRLAPAVHDARAGADRRSLCRPACSTRRSGSGSASCWLAIAGALRGSKRSRG